MNIKCKDGVQQNKSVSHMGHNLNEGTNELIVLFDLQDRKTLFPPRPKPKKPKNKRTEQPVRIDALRSCLNGLSQDSGLGSSQECPPLGLDKIVVPKRFTEDASSTDLPANLDVDVINIPSTSKHLTLNDIVKGQSSRKRKLSESSMSDDETKRPRWRDIKKSPKENSLSLSPSRKRKSTSCDRDLLIKKLKYSDQHKSSSSLKSASEDEIEPQKTFSTNGNSACQESIDVGKTSDLGSEISSGSGSGIFCKTEEVLPVVVDSKEICIFCNTTPINAGFLHGNIAHRCCCYTCAKKTWKTIKRCPMCNRKVNKVIRVY